MADDNFRSYRDARAPRAAPARAQSDDPLAELARLIGQSEPMDDYSRGDGRAEPATAYDQPAGSLDWATHDRPDDVRYADPYQPPEDNYEPGHDEGYEEARSAAALPSHRPDPRDAEYDRQGQVPTPAPRFNGAHEYARDHAAPEPSRYPAVREQPASLSRQPPAFLPQIQNERYEDERYEYDDQPQDGPHDEPYALEDYEEEAPATPRRSGLVVVAAVLGLAVIGTAGAFAYRAMFGSSMLPSLPPIIKADSGPNKIVPTKPATNSSDQADANGAKSGEKIVSREEQPVDMPAPVNPTSRVVSTVPIFPDPNSGQAGVPSAAHEGVLTSGGSNFPSAVAPAPMTSPAPAAQAASIWPPASSGAPVAGAGTASAPIAANGPRKVHTVIIHSDQTESADASSAPAAMPAPAPGRATPSHAMPAAPRPAAPARVEANGPLSIVPSQDGAAPAPRIRTALARPTTNPPAPSPTAQDEAPAAGGGYAVQVTSQRSEAEAQAEFRTLRAKFPTQLGNRQPIVRRADLGAKGIYYRALVGPFASQEQASGMCASLKAAGGNCIVQHD